MLDQMYISRLTQGNEIMQQLGLRNYGEMATMHLGSKTWVFLNTHRVTQEIIAKRGSITNGRSEYPIASGIVSRDGRSLVLPPAKWAEKRRVMHHLLNGSALKKYGEFQEMESTQMLAEYLFKPQDWYRNHYRYANSVVHRIALGERFVMSSQNLVNTQRLVAEFTGSIGTSIIDWFPALAKLPKFLQPWRPYWEKIGQFHYDVYRTWWDPVKKHIDEGTAPPSFARDGLLSPDAKFSGDEQEAMYVTLQLIEAGSDTTREVLNCFVMATLCYPHKFQKLRDEIDKVCGNNAERLPVLTDIENIPYVHAFAKELLRWRPIFISTPDHMLTEDLEFEGYTFPAGTCFVINEIAVGYECESPTEFIPERWLDGTETDITHGLWQFGGGRRICVGYKLAQRSLFLNIARLAYCFDYQAVRLSCFPPNCIFQLNNY